MAKKLRGRRTALSLLSALSMGAMMAAPAASAMAASPADVSATQLAGNTRYGTAVKIAEQMYPGGPSSHTVVITSGADANLVDALTAAPLARALHAPILLAQSPTELGSDVLSYISSNGITKVVLIGAVGANASTIESQLPSGVSVVGNYSGATRFQTAAAIAEALLSLEGKTSFSTVFVASGEQNNLIDALAGDPVAARLGDPILLAASSGSTLPSAREQSLLSGSSQQFVLGAAASYPVTTTMNGAVKLFGNSRFSTATAIDTYSAFVPSGGYSTIVVANGAQSHLVDAIAGGPLAAKDNAALVLVNDSAVPDSTSLFLQNSTYDQASTLLVLGGPASIPSSTVQAVSGLVGLTTNQQQVPAEVKLTAASANLLADGSAKDTITVSVLDANGNVVRNFNGSVTVASTTNDIYKATGNVSSTTVNITNGVGTFQVEAGTSVGESISLTPSALSPVTTTNNIVYSAVTVTETAPSATQLALTVETGSPTALSANTQTPTTLVLSVEDAAGNTFSGAPGEYVTVSVAGQGTLVGGATSETVFVSQTSTVVVESVTGTAGTITVAAGASGLTSASLSIPTYVNTAPASLAISATTGTDSNGNPYTEYTVSVLDTNGHLISYDSGTINVSANVPVNLASPSSITTSSPSIFLGSVSSTGTFTSATVVSGTLQATFQNGVYTFAVETDKVGSSPVTITVKDTTDNLTASASYTLVPGAATGVTVTPSSTAVYDVEPGQSFTFMAQLVDAYQNAVSEAGQSVVFGFTGTNSAGATLPNGLSSGTYTVTTGSSGTAAVTVTVPSGASAGTSFQLEATYNSGSVSGPTITVVSPVAYVNLLAVTGTPTQPVTAGYAVPTFYVSSEYAAGVFTSGASTGDTLQITTSNSGVVTLESGGVAVTALTVTATASSNGVAVTSTTGPSAWGLSAEQAGTATITVTDISNPSKPSVSFTVSVEPGQATTSPLIEYNGKPISSTNELTVAANTPVALQLVNVDAGGNPVPVAGSEPLWVALSAAVGNFEATDGGATVNAVYIPAGQDSTTIYFVAPTATTISGGLNAGDITVTVAPAAATLNTTTPSGTFTITVAAPSWSTVSVSGLTLVLSEVYSSGATLAISPSSTLTTNSSGQATFTATAGSSPAGSVTVYATISGTSNAGMTDITE